MSGTIQNKAWYVDQNRTYKYLVVLTDDSSDGDEEEGAEGEDDEDSKDKEGQSVKLRFNLEDDWQKIFGVEIRIERI